MPTGITEAIETVETTGRAGGAGRYTSRSRRLSRAAAAALVALGVAVGGGVPARADAASDRAEQLRYAVETINLGNDAFLRRKNDFLNHGCSTVATCRKPVPYNAFDWSTDSCSWTPSSWKSLFHPACQQHDFGYRNFSKNLTLGRNETTRAWIDGRFREEMKAICNYKFSDWTKYANLQACFKEADVMWSAVRGFNSWANPPTGRVLASPCLNHRSGPGGSTTLLGCIPVNTVITIECVRTGTSVAGPYGSVSTWDRITYAGRTGYVADAWVYTGSNYPVAAPC